MTVARVAYILNVFPKLSETFIAGELAELRRAGIDVRVLSLRRPEEPAGHRSGEASMVMPSITYDPDRFRALLRDFRPQLVHAHFATQAAAAARQWAAECAVPFTFTAHGYDVYRRPPADFADRAASAAAVVTVSKANARYMVETLGVARSHIHVIGCGVDLDRFCPSGERAEPPTIVCVARLRPVKNLTLLLEACAILRARTVRFRCVIVGEGDARLELEALRDRLGLAASVALPGPADQPEVLSQWRMAAVATLTSHSEGMPVSLMEAAACGVPAVATAVGGVPELVDDGVTGIVVPAGDATSLGGALERLLRDAALRTRMGAAARQRAEREFSRPRQVGRLVDLWNSVVADPTVTLSPGRRPEDFCACER